MITWPMPVENETAQDYAARVRVTLRNGQVVAPTAATAALIVEYAGMLGMPLVVEHNSYVVLA